MEFTVNDEYETLTLDRTAILRFLTENPAEIRQFGVRKIGLFGSYARNEQTETSDIDFLVEFYPAEKSYDHLIGLIDFLEYHLNRSVEVVTLQSLSPFLVDHIEKDLCYGEGIHFGQRSSGSLLHQVQL